MTEKTQSSSSDRQLTFPNLLQAFDLGSLLAVQQRNMEAMTKTAAIIADMAASVGSKEMALWSGFADARPAVDTSKNGWPSPAHVFSGQMSNGHNAITKFVDQSRAITDEMRECWYKVTKELESCAADNLGSLGRQFENVTSQERRGAVVSSASNTQRQKNVTA